MWDANLVRRLPKDILLDSISDLLWRMGFRNYERVSNEKEWGADIVAIREDPIAGTEKLLLLVHERGLASSKDINVFAQTIDRHKAHKGVLVSPAGFTKDAKLLSSREYLGKIVLWDGEKLASLLNNYGVEVPEGAEKFLEPPEKEKQKEKLQEFELDASLLYDFSPEELLKKVARHASKNYPLSPEDIKLSSLSLELSVAYIVSWDVKEKELKGRAVVFSKDNIVLNADEDKDLAVPVKKAVLNERAVVKATERKIETPLTPSEATLILKELIAKKESISENDVSITDRRKVYVPVRAFMDLQVGDNEGKATVDLKTGEISLSIEPLSEKYFIDKTRELVEEETGERPKEIDVEKSEKKVKVKGKTERFSFEAVFNPYTGSLVRIETRMSDEALRELLKSLYPGGKILGLEKNKKSAVADVLVDGEIVVLLVDLRNGEVKEVRKLPSPEVALKKAKTFVESNFPLSGLELKDYRVIEHKYLELMLASESGTARVKIDGATGDVLDYYVEVSKKRAGELVLEKYPGYEIITVIDEKDSYTVEAASETHEIVVKLSKDGKMLEETDRVLKRELASKIADEKVKEIDPEARVESLELAENWVAEFTGVTKVGRIVLHRATGEVIESESWFTERALEEMYHKHLREKYGEEELRTERITHYKDKGYLHIKVSGRESVYYARIDTKTGEILSEDKAPTKGLTAKIKQMQLEGKYK